ncbi:EamA family transporter [Cytobacillus horneckiae]|uniref:EamA family transporter n=1 Tax=Cytobacillus horneckiae TaxID=549687 RepID=A0A2N0ZEG8_9BACI|nr:EamA family transporter [Cytobacillus horneckiae]
MTICGHPQCFVKKSFTAFLSIVDKDRIFIIDPSPLKKTWALVIAAPFFIIPVYLNFSNEMLHAPIEAWASFIYLAVVSQFLAYVAWYNGLAKGGISRVSQIQYLQPFLMILFAALFLNESITIFTMATAVIVVFSVVIGKNTVVANQSASDSSNKLFNSDSM